MTAADAVMAGVERKEAARKRWAEGMESVAWLAQSCGPISQKAAKRESAAAVQISKGYIAKGKFGLQRKLS